MSGKILWIDAVGITGENDGLHFQINFSLPHITMFREVYITPPNSPPMKVLEVECAGSVYLVNETFDSFKARQEQVLNG